MRGGNLLRRVASDCMRTASVRCFLLAFEARVDEREWNREARKEGRSGDTMNAEQTAHRTD